MFLIFFTVQMMEFSLWRHAKRQFTITVVGDPIKTEKIQSKSLDDLTPEEFKIRKQFWKNLEKKMLKKKSIRARID